MRFMLLIKSNRSTDAGLRPGTKLLSAMGKFHADLKKAGVLLTAEGLQPSSAGFRLINQSRQITQINGPFDAPETLLAGFWLIQVKSKEEAIEWAKRVPIEATGTSDTTEGIGQIEIRQVTELEDFPVTPDESGWREEESALRAGNGCFQPLAAAAGTDSEAAAGPKLRYLMMFKADQQTESGVLPDPQILAAMGALMGELTQSGVMLGGEGLQPSSKGARVQFSAGKRTVTDGPFTETKELVCGYCLVQVDSHTEALEIARRYLLIHGDGESEIRRVFDAPDFIPVISPALSVVASKRDQISVH